MTHARFVTQGGFAQTGQTYSVVTAPNEFRLSGTRPLILNLRQQYEVVVQRPRALGNNKVRVNRFTYRIDTEIDRTVRELMSFHWNPAGGEVAPYCHMHVKAPDNGEWWPNFASIHLPASRVPVEDLVWMLINDLNVHPIRNDWEAVLRQGRRGLLC